MAGFFYDVGGWLPHVAALVRCMAVKELPDCLWFGIGVTRVSRLTVVGPCCLGCRVVAAFLPGDSRW